MFIEKILVINEATNRVLNRYKYSCDQCTTNFVKGRHSSKMRFCSRNCLNESQRSGVIAKEKRAYFVEKFGVDNPYKSRLVICNRKLTMMNRYGVENPSQIDDVKIKKIKTFIEHYGVVNNLCRKDVLEKAQNTLIERYGSLAPTTHPSVREKLRSPEVRAKRFNSWKKSGSIRSSKPERRLAAMLHIVFGDIMTHVSVNGWSIDVNIPAQSCYIQVDGIWWHGLDRPIEVIAEKARLGSLVDCEILRKRGRDEAQNLWFKTQNIKLVRITDVEINSMDDIALNLWCLELEA